MGIFLCSVSKMMEERARTKFRSVRFCGFLASNLGVFIELEISELVWQTTVSINLNSIMSPILPSNFRLSCINCTFPFFEDFRQQNTLNRQDVTTCLDQSKLQFPFSKDHFLYKAIVPMNKGTSQIRLSYSVHK